MALSCCGPYRFCGCVQALCQFSPLLLYSSYRTRAICFARYNAHNSKGFTWVFAKDFIAIDPHSSLWVAVHPLLEAALSLEHHDDEYVWHGWNKRVVAHFLSRLPQHCTLLLGVWDTSSN